MIPTEFEVKGQTITVPIRYSNQWELDVWPVIILEYTIITGNVFVPLNRRRRVTPYRTDTITFVSGTSLYDLSRTKVKEITEVKGILGGLVHTFVDGTDYQLTGDQIEWLGVDEPDDSTEFDVTFIAKWINVLLGGEKFDNLSVNIYTKDYGTKAAGNFINGVYLADSIAGQLHKFFEFETENSVDLVIITQPDIRNLDALAPGEYHRRRQFDVHLRHLESYELEPVEDVEEVETEVQIA